MTVIGLVEIVNRDALFARGAHHDRVADDVDRRPPARPVELIEVVRPGLRARGRPRARHHDAINVVPSIPVHRHGVFAVTVVFRVMITAIATVDVHRHGDSKGSSRQQAVVVLGNIRPDRPIDRGHPAYV